MVLLKKDGGDQNQENQNRQSRRRSVIAVSAVFAVLAAAVIFFFLTQKKAGAPSSSTLPPLQQSDHTSEGSDPALMASKAPDTQETPPLTQTAGSGSTKTPDITLPPGNTPAPEEITPTPGDTSTPESTRTPADTPVPDYTRAPTPTPEITKAPEETPDSVESAVQMLLAKMSLEEKIYQLFIVTPEQLRGSGGAVTQIDQILQSALQQRPVGGVICFEENIRNREQTTGLLAGLQAASRLGLFIAVDEEGGRVARLGKNSAMGTTAFPPMIEIGDSGNTENARNVGRTIGKEIKPFGFNLDLAPVADVFSNPNNPSVGNRCFSRDPLVAAEMVAACVAGFKESGMLCTLKHFPGHGDTEADSHYGSAFSSKTQEQLQACEFLPFKAGIDAGADAVMIAHVSLPNVTGNDLPATLSYEIITGILRGQLGFDGLVITDAMEMGAITKYFSSGEAAVKAIQAGVDILLMPKDLEAAVSGILAAVKNGGISEKRLDESVCRILHVKLEQGIIPLSAVR